MPALAKWYLDGVTPAGDVFIGYTGELRVLGLRIPWSEWTLFSAAGAIEQRAVWRRSIPAEDPGGCFRWSVPALSVEGIWRRTTGTTSLTVPLLETPDTRIVWEL